MKIKSDEKLNSVLQEAASNLRDCMLEQISNNNSRFITEPHTEKPAIIITDTITGKQTTASLYGADVALQVLRELFENTETQENVVYSVSCWVNYKDKNIYERTEFFTFLGEGSNYMIEEMKNKCNAIGYYANHDWSIIVRKHQVLEDGKISPFGARLQEINKQVDFYFYEEEQI